MRQVMGALGRQLGRVVLDCTALFELGNIVWSGFGSFTPYVLLAYAARKSREASLGSPH
jgi:hypothetical protein